MSRRRRYPPRHTPASFTDEQMREIIETSKFVAPELRDAFLRKVSLAIRLTGGNAAYPTDRAVSSALEAAFEDEPP